MSLKWGTWSFLMINMGSVVYFESISQTSGAVYTHKPTTSVPENSSHQIHYLLLSKQHLLKHNKQNSAQLIWELFSKILSSVWMHYTWLWCDNNVSLWSRWSDHSQTEMPSVYIYTCINMFFFFQIRYPNIACLKLSVNEDSALQNISNKTIQGQVKVLLDLYLKISYAMVKSVVYACFKKNKCRFLDLQHLNSTSEYFERWFCTSATINLA